MSLTSVLWSWVLSTAIGFYFGFKAGDSKDGYED